MDMQVGRVTHFYKKILVAIVEVMNKPLHVGDVIRFSGHDKEFKQKILSMQVEYTNIQSAKIGESVGIKVDEPVKAGDKVFLAHE